LQNLPFENILQKESAVTDVDVLICYNECLLSDRLIQAYRW